MSDLTISNRPAFKPSAETEKLITRLRSVGVNEVITYAQMQEATGVDCQAERGHITTARKHLLDEDQAVFAAVHRIGLKRLDGSSVVEQEGTTSVKVRRAVKKSLRRLSTVKPDELSPTEGQQYRATSASLGAIALCVTPTNLGKVAQLTMASASVDAKATLALFTK